MAERRTEQYYESRLKAAQETKAKFEIYDVDAHLVETDPEIRPSVHGGAPIVIDQGHFWARTPGTLAGGGATEHPTAWKNGFA